MNDALTMRYGDALNQTQVLYHLPASEYHLIDAIGSGGLEKILRSPRHFRLAIDKPSEPSAEMMFGTVVHLGVMEPLLFHDKVMSPIAVDGRTKEGKALKAEAEAKGKILISLDDYSRAIHCIQAVREHPAARRLIEGGKYEVSLFWQDLEYDVPCKARLDILNLGGITDLKTTKDASKEAFAASVARYGYHTQAAHYCSGSEHCFDASPEFWAWIAVESEEPHAVAVYQCGMASLLAGQRRQSEALARYKRARESGVYEGYPSTIETLEIPTWARRFND